MGELEDELGQYGVCLLKVMLRAEGAKLRLVSCPNSFSSCDSKYLRPMKERESTGLGNEIDGLVTKSGVKGETHVLS